MTTEQALGLPNSQVPEQPVEYSFKLLYLGLPASGKTTHAMRLAGVTDFSSQVGIRSSTKQLEIYKRTFQYEKSTTIGHLWAYDFPGYTPFNFRACLNEVDDHIVKGFLNNQPFLLAFYFLKNTRPDEGDVACIQLLDKRGLTVKLTICKADSYDVEELAEMFKQVKDFLSAKGLGKLFRSICGEPEILIAVDKVRDGKVDIYQRSLAEPTKLLSGLAYFKLLNCATEARRNYVGKRGYFTPIATRVAAAEKVIQLVHEGGIAYVLIVLFIFMMFVNMLFSKLAPILNRV